MWEGTWTSYSRMLSINVTWFLSSFRMFLSLTPKKFSIFSSVLINSFRISIFLWVSSTTFLNGFERLLLVSFNIRGSLIWANCLDVSTVSHNRYHQNIALIGDEVVLVSVLSQKNWHFRKFKISLIQFNSNSSSYNNNIFACKIKNYLETLMKVRRNSSYL